MSDVSERYSHPGWRDRPVQDNFFLLSLSDTLEDDDVTLWQDSYQQHLSPPRSLAQLTPLEEKLKQFEYVSFKF